ncbi:MULTISPECIES: DUF1987 domain-containing protein [Leptospira]|uniref:SiaC family regulatory phosphoprotein domain-containing protein n=6 Tax=Leptospira santarosai TaxID=28183 RepID=A0AB73MEF0_9LEPT|nr:MULTISPECIES: DUF1987 domain-containing protein [Leptospira]EMO57193.1 PF09345 domain protein [Leptospira santarosai str. CBC1416]ASV11335.1 DUF1987 domain-containing protein [Leptospira santarosai]AVV49812.1 PF09345 domain protein [Leptospira santarosai]AVV79437.1 PF09345 domain protein [Leptospira santarosai]EKO35803.1 PF09345 domain protein [Leptospira santarosai str. MOR084]
MESLHIQQTKTSPEVVLDTEQGLIEIIGESYPENAIAFYKPVFDWLNAMINLKSQVQVKFQLDYFNTSSSKVIMDILDSLQKYHDQNGKVKVLWLYKEDDDDMQETGEEFSSDLSLPFELKSYK